MKLSGVGPKAADCILLFAFQKYEAFPVDVWIRRIMQQNYMKKPEHRFGTHGRRNMTKYESLQKVTSGILRICTGIPVRCT